MNMKYKVTINMIYSTPSALGMTNEKSNEVIKRLFDSLIEKHIAECEWTTNVEIIEE